MNASLFLYSPRLDTQKHPSTPSDDVAQSNGHAYVAVGVGHLTGRNSPSSSVSSLSPVRELKWNNGLLELLAFCLEFLNTRGLPVFRYSFAWAVRPARLTGLVLAFRFIDDLEKLGVNLAVRSTSPLPSG